MTRKSKQEKRRARSPRKRHYSIREKTGPKKDALEFGYKKAENAAGLVDYVFIAKISR